LRRFLLHVLPKGFVRIRFFGFLAHRRRALLPRCQQLLTTQPQPLPHSPVPATRSADSTWNCPVCGGPMILVERLTAQQIATRSAGLRSFIDTS
jgi:hypothetical protein